MAEPQKRPREVAPAGPTEPPPEWGQPAPEQPDTDPITEENGDA